MSNPLLERLQDPNERFSSAEFHQIFEALSEKYGYYRDERLPSSARPVETASLTVTGYEDLGVLIVRPRTLRDQMLTIPNRVDVLLGRNMDPSQSTTINASMIALAETLIVQPPGFVEKLLESASDDDLGFFQAFAIEYVAWMDSRSEGASKKKRGKKSGKEPSS